MEVVKMAMRDTETLQKCEEDLMVELSASLGNVPETEPTEGELWDWASYGTAAQVAQAMEVGEDALGPANGGRREHFRHRKE